MLTRIDALEYKKVPGIEAALQGLVNDNIELAASATGGLKDVEASTSDLQTRIDMQKCNLDTAISNLAHADSRAQQHAAFL